MGDEGATLLTPHSLLTPPLAGTTTTTTHPPTSFNTCDFCMIPAMRIASWGVILQLTSLRVVRVVKLSVRKWER